MRPSRTTGSTRPAPGPDHVEVPEEHQAGRATVPGSRPTTLGRPGSTSHSSTSMPRPSRRRANQAANAPRPAACRAGVRAVDAHDLGQQGSSFDMRPRVAHGRGAATVFATTALVVCSAPQVAVVRRRAAERSVHAPAGLDLVLARSATAVALAFLLAGGRRLHLRLHVAVAGRHGGAGVGWHPRRDLPGRAPGPDPAIDWEGQDGYRDTMFNTFVKYASASGSAGTDMLPDLATEGVDQQNGGIADGGTTYTFHLEEGHQARGGPGGHLRRLQVQLRAHDGRPGAGDRLLHGRRRAQRLWTARPKEIVGTPRRQVHRRHQARQADMAFMGAMAMSFTDVVAREWVEKWGGRSAVTVNCRSSSTTGRRVKDRSTSRRTRTTTTPSRPPRRRSLRVRPTLFIALRNCSVATSTCSATTSHSAEYARVKANPNTEEAASSKSRSIAIDDRRTRPSAVLQPQGAQGDQHGGGRHPAHQAPERRLVLTR